MAKHNELGALGEELAVKYLAKNGYKILETNYRFGRDEVDIIASINDLIVFVEVKTRASSFLGEPEEAVSKAKQKRIIKVANNYLIENDLDNEGRFDIFGIIINQKTKNIKHLIDAFQPLW
jgi:putative endonuclease